MTGKRKPMTVAAVFDAAYPLTALVGQTPKQTFCPREGASTWSAVLTCRDLCRAGP